MLSTKWEKFAQDNNLNADGRKVLRVIEFGWDIVMASAIIIGGWAWIWGMWIAFG